MGTSRIGQASRERGREKGQRRTGSGRMSWRESIYRVIFEAETRAGKVYDILLILAILASVVVVMLDSTAYWRTRHGDTLVALEWGFTILFLLEYLFRIISARERWRYLHSFFGIVDFIAVVPTLFAMLVPGAQYLLVVRILRVLRVFRVLKLSRFTGEGRLLLNALIASQRRIGLFLMAVVSLVVVIGSLMYLVEGEEHGFTSIPTSIYWAIVTLTTVGYGDISPQTGLGRSFAALIMILGYSIIAVPTGIVSASMVKAERDARHEAEEAGRRCPVCRVAGHREDARFCRRCGERLRSARRVEKKARALDKP